MPIRLCSARQSDGTGCPNVASYRGRCADHAREQNRLTRGNHRHIYNSKRWRILRRRVLFEQSLCAVHGCDEIATEVDHIRAIEDGGLPWARENLQGMCAPHHSQKTSRELRSR